jgi:acetyl esterase/lipase
MRDLLILALMTSFTIAAEPVTIKLWPGTAPGDPADYPAEKIEPADPAKKTVVRITNVSVPLIEVYLAPKEKASGAFVLVAPGGGYNILAYEHEGTAVAKWLNGLGIGAAVLKYRVPRRPGVTPEYLPMIQDSQRAIAIIRSKAKEWNLDDKKIGMLGFSAGGHLTAVTSLTAKRMYDGKDEPEPKVDFAVLVYPGGLVEKDSATLKPEFTVTKASPPMFFAHASDDRVSSENSIALYRELKKNGVPAELHLYETGGHGYGLGRDIAPVNTWPKRCEDWFRLHGLMK